jgi:hypothetical protein
MTVRRQQGDDGVEVAVLHIEFDNTALDVLYVSHVGCSYGKEWRKAPARAGAAGLAMLLLQD